MPRIGWWRRGSRGFAPVAGAAFDEVEGPFPGVPSNGRPVFPENFKFAGGGVVFLEFGDLLIEAASPVIVEHARGELFGVPGEAFEDFQLQFVGFGDVEVLVGEFLICDGHGVIQIPHYRSWRAILLPQRYCTTPAGLNIYCDRVPTG